MLQFLVELLQLLFVIGNHRLALFTQFVEFFVDILEDFFVGDLDLLASGLDLVDPPEQLLLQGLFLLFFLGQFVQLFGR